MRFIVLGLAVVIAVFLAWYVNQQASESKNLKEALERATRPVATQAAAPQSMTTILVADKNLSAGTLLKPSDFSFKPWPLDAVNPNYKTKENTPAGENIVGALVRKDITAGDPITNAAITSPRDQGFLAGVLRPGTKATSIVVNDTTGVSGFIFPGDYIDLVLVQTLPQKTVASTDRQKSGVSVTSERVSETIARNIRVIARGFSIDKPWASPALSKEEQEKQQANNGQPVAQAPAPALSQNAGTLTLEVTPELAEMLLLATDIGRVSAILSPALGEGKEISSEQQEKLKTYPYMMESVLDASYNKTAITGDQVSPALAESLKGGGDANISVFRAKQGAAAPAQ
jgi:Flp pilus assembly protein CpaB